MLGSTHIIGTVLNKSRQIDAQGTEGKAAKPGGWPWRLFRRGDA